VQEIEGKAILVKTDLGQKVGCLKWSPDGQIIFYFASRNIWAMDKGGKTTLQITDERAKRLSTGFAVSPDGTRIIYYFEDVNRSGFKIVALDLKGIRERLRPKPPAIPR